MLFSSSLSFLTLISQIDYQLPFSMINKDYFITISHISRIIIAKFFNREPDSQQMTRKILTIIV